MIKFVCTCGRRFSNPDKDAGKRARCPCGQPLRIPGAAASETAAMANLAEDTDSTPRSQAPASVSLQPQQRIGPYVVTRQLGQGAMGEVWLAHDASLQRQVAIKVLPRELRQDAERLRRFQREARLAAQLQHGNTVVIHHIGEEQNLLYIVMEYVAGGSLAELVERAGPLDWQTATRAIRDAAAGLAEAHEVGLVHRDIKPANLLRTPKGLTKVADFGLARASVQTTPQTQLTQLGSVLGTPSYMAPEQWLGQATDCAERSVFLDLHVLLSAHGPATLRGPAPGGAGLPASLRAAAGSACARAGDSRQRVGDPAAWRGEGAPSSLSECGGTDQRIWMPH